MSEYLSGTPEELQAFRSQCEILLKDSAVHVVGSFGRLAMYAAYGWQTPPKSLTLNSDYEPLPDIDILATTRRQAPRVTSSGPHRVDCQLDYLIKQRDPPSLCYNEWMIIPIDRRVFSTVVRASLGVPMRTFMVGTQLELESLVEPWHYDQEKYIASRQQFTEFAGWVREHHPEEFLPEELYRPFAELRALQEQDGLR